MLDDKEKLLKKNRLFTIRKNKKALTAYEKAKRFYFAFSVLFSFALVCAFYFTSDFSKIYRITVSGNEYLKSEEIIAQSGLNEDSSFLLMLPWRAEKKIRENHLIDTAKVKRLPGRLVEIEVSEKKIVGYAPENGLNVLILEDGERVGVTRQDMYLIANAPIIQGFDEEELLLLTVSSFGGGGGGGGGGGIPFPFPATTLIDVSTFAAFPVTFGGGVGLGLGGGVDFTGGLIVG